MNESQGQPTIDELASRLKPHQIDWEPRVREEPWRPYRRMKRTGL